MRENLRFLFLLVGTTFGIFVIAAAIVKVYASPEVLEAIGYGYGVSLLYILTGFFSLKWAFRKPTRTFYSVVFGGMLTRFFLTGAFLFCAWKYTEIHLYGFIFSLMGFYLTLQFFEIWFITRSLTRQSF